jgi:hypothetical protein
MYNPEQKQVIVKNSFGVSYHVFYEAGRGLCVRMLGESGIWSRGYVLSQESVNDFSVILDKDDIFHFVFQSVDGRILYGHGRHGQIEIQTALTSRDTTPWMKYVCLLMHKGKILLFYLVRYQKRYLLSMQAIKDNSFSKPAAIDYVDGSGKNYQVVEDQLGKCHLFYTNNDGAVKRLNHRLYNEESGIFSAPEKIVGSEHEILLCSAIGAENRIHLLYRISSENLYQVYYRPADSGSPSECLYKGSSPPGCAGLVYHYGILRVFRVSSDCIYSRTSGDNGETWTDEALVPLGSGTSLTCFSYFTNYAREQEFFCNELPGTFSKGYQLAFLSHEAAAEFSRDLYPDMPGLRPPTIRGGRENRADDKKAVKDDPKEMPDSPVLKEIQKKVMLLQNLTENMQRDLTKLWLTQKGHEKKLTRLERFYERLKNELEGETEENDSISGGAEQVSPKEKDETLQRCNGTEPIVQKETDAALQRHGSTDRVPGTALEERTGDFIDDDEFNDSGEEDVASWYDEEESI